MFWRRIRNLFHKWDRIFDIFRIANHEWKYYLKKSCLTSDFNVKIIKWSFYYIFVSCLNMFLSNVHSACNICRDVTITRYFHAVKITLYIFSQCENNSLWNISLLFKGLNPAFHCWKCSNYYTYLRNTQMVVRSSKNTVCSSSSSFKIQTENHWHWFLW